MANPKKEETKIPSQKDFLSHLDFEISQISDEQTRNGWTKWALYGVIASCTWLFFDQIEKGNVAVESVALLVLTFGLTADFIYASYRLLPSVSDNRETVPRFRKAADRGSLTTLWLLFFRYVATLFLACYFTGTVHWTQAVITVAFYSVITITLLCLILLLIFREPEIIDRAEKKNQKNLVYIQLLGVLGLAWAGIGYWSTVLSLSPGVSNYRLAGLLIVAACSVYLIVENARKAPLLSFLVEIRREMTFKRIDLLNAVKQTEIALVGAYVDEGIQEDILKLVSILGAQEIQLENCSAQLDAAVIDLQKDGANMTKQGFEKVSEVLQDAQKALQGYLGQSPERIRSMRRLQTRMSLIGDETRESVKAGREVIAGIQDFGERIDVRTTEIEKIADQIRAELERLETNTEHLN